MKRNIKRLKTRYIKLWNNDPVIFNINNIKGPLILWNINVLLGEIEVIIINRILHKVEYNYIDVLEGKQSLKGPYGKGYENKSQINEYKVYRKNSYCVTT